MTIINVQCCFNLKPQIACINNITVNTVDLFEIKLIQLPLIAPQVLSCEVHQRLHYNP